MATILASFLTAVEPAISLASVADGAGRISAVIDNSATKATRGKIGVRITCGATPTANKVLKVYVIEQSAAVNNVKGGGGALGDVDAAVATEPVNAHLIGVIASSGTANETLAELFDYEFPAPKFSLLIWNATGGALNATPATPPVQWLPVADTVA